MDIIETTSATEALVEAFVETAYIAVCNEAQIEIAVGHLASRLESVFPGRCFAFITAWNPLGQRQSDEENNAADRELTQLIDSHRVERIPMLATSPDGEWFETGWLIADVSRVTLDQWGRRFGQLGTLWWQRGHAVKLRIYHPKIPASDNVFIDWIE